MYETGWDATDWNTYIPTGAGATSTWNTNLSSCSPYGTWTSTAGSQETLPINCVNWYESYAFCIWDGGFLPSEAEWAYVAAGGSQEREYPWGSTDPTTANQYAIYLNYYYTVNPTTGVVNVAPVGTATLGAAYWGQLDMEGEVWEWNLDWVATYVDPCTNCAYLTSASYRVLRGSNWTSRKPYLLSPLRFGEAPTYRITFDGFRCARTP
jgi:formylglycine-generating enzyme required for sulfatase activity